MKIEFFNEFILYNNLRLIANIIGDHLLTNNSHALMLMIALQESNLMHRNQYPVAFAKGFWQFERSGCHGLWLHNESKPLLLAVANEIRYPLKTSIDLWEGVENNDTIAVAAARALLWTDPKPLPSMKDIDKCWKYYINNWRPGKPDRDRWTSSYERAIAEVERFYL